MRLDSIPDLNFILELKGLIDVYCARYGSKKIWIAREWPRKPQIIYGSNYEKSVIGATNCFQYYKTISGSFKNIFMKWSMLGGQDGLAYFRRAFQADYFRNKFLNPCPDNIDLIFHSENNQYELILESSITTEIFIATNFSCPKELFYYAQVKKNGDFIKRKRTVLIDCSDYDISIVIHPDNPCSIFLSPDSRIALLLRQPTISNIVRPIIWETKIKNLAKLF